MELPKLTGTSDGRHWKFQLEGEKPDDTPGMAIFAILTVEIQHYRLIGTGFNITPAGHFVTAKHVAEELIQVGLQYARIVTLLPGKQFLLRPIGAFNVHPTADIALGCPREIIDNRTQLPHRGKCVSLSTHHPAAGTPIATWAHPRHRMIHTDEGTKLVLEPDFYDGHLEELFIERGPSGRLAPPYFLTSIHLHGASSGGPVFDTTGKVFGVASSSYDGMEDISFVTPMSEALSIVLKDGAKEITFYDFARQVRLLPDMN